MVQWGWEADRAMLGVGTGSPQPGHGPCCPQEGRADLEDKGCSGWKEDAQNRETGLQGAEAGEPAFKGAGVAGV